MKKRDLEDKYIDEDFFADCIILNKYLSYDYLKDKYFSLYDVKWIKHTLKLIIKKLEKGKDNSYD